MENLVSLVLNFAEIAAGTGEDWYLANPLPGEWELVAAYFTPWTSRSTHASNYTTLSLKQGSTTLASLTTNSSGGQALTAGTTVALTLSGGKSLEFGQGDVLNVNKTDAASGLALDGTVTAYLRRIG